MAKNSRDDTDREAAAQQSAMVKGLNGFGLQTLQSIMALDMEPDDGNILISGLSVGIALQMALWGARGETADEIAAMLGLGGLPDSHHAARLLTQQLVQTDATTILQVANALWARQGVQLDKTYVAGCRQALDAELQALDFSDPAASQRINGWVSDATQGLIPRLVPDQIHPLTMLFITNALYFRGQWADMFEVSQTRPESFTCWDGHRQQTAMMFRSGTMAYLENEQLQAVQLDYVGGDLAMEIYVPREARALPRVLAALEPEQFDRWSWRFRRQQGTLGLPRFQMSNTWTLNAPLMAVGMKRAFDPAQADFGGMLSGTVNPGLYVSNVMHNTFLQVDEQGAEAAAATAVEMRVRSLAAPPKPFSLVADRPFLVVLRDKTSGAALMHGVVGMPKEPDA